MLRNLQILFFLSLFCFSTSAWAIVNVTIEPRVSFSVDTDPPEITITLDNIEDRVEGGGRYVERLSISITQVDTGDVLPIQGVDDATEVSTAPYIWIITQEELVTPGMDPSGNPQDTAVMRLQLRKNQSGDGIPEFSELFDDNNNQLNLIVIYNDDESPQPIETTITLERSDSLAAEAPTSVRVSGTHLALTAKWDNASSIAYTDGDNDPPGGVSFFVVEANMGDVVVDGEIYVEGAEGELETTDCTINTNATDGENCVTCNGDEVFISKGNLPNTVDYASVSNDASSVTVGDLEDKDGAGNEITYIGFMIYEPDGIVRSACYTGIPRRNLTFAELVDGDIDAKEKTPRCFIATAAYGSPFHSKVDLFRWFRDRHLKQYWLGRQFVHYYYEYSPPLADFIAERPWLRTTVRTILWPFAKGVEWLKGDTEEI